MRKKVMQYKRWITFVLVLLFFAVCCAPLSAYAAYPSEPIDYMDLDYYVQEGPVFNRVTVPISYDYYFFKPYNDITGEALIGSAGLYFHTMDIYPNTSYSLYIYPTSYHGLSLNNIPEGSRLVFDFSVLVEGTENYYIPSLVKRMFYTTSTQEYISAVLSDIPGTFSEDLSVTFELDDFPDNAANVVPCIKASNFRTAYDGVTTYRFYLKNVSLVMDIPTGYWEQWLAEQNGQMIDDLGDRIEGSISDSTDQITGSIEDSTDLITDYIKDSSEDIVGVLADSTNVIVGGNHELDGIADESNKEMSAAAGKLDNLGDQLNSVDKPNVDSVNVSADKLLGGMAATSMLTAPVLEIWKNPVALSFLTVVVTIVLISWVFFGKK